MTCSRLHLPSLLLAVFVLLIPARAARAATTSGVISANETWSGTVSLTGDVTVGTNVTLTVLPGTRVRCDARADDRHAGVNASRIELIVNGALKAEGTEEAPITFTSWPVNAADAPQPGDWQGIVLAHGTRSSSLSWCVVEYATQGITVSAAPPSVTHCTVRNHQEYGILVRTSLRLLHSTIERSVMGIQCDTQGSVPLELSDCLLRNNDKAIWNLPWCSTRITATRCLFEANNYGADGHLAPPPGSSFVDCTFSNNIVAGIRSAYGDPIAVTATNSVFDGNGSAIVGGFDQAFRLVDCLIRNSKGPGIVDDGVSVRIEALRTTITRNGGPGIRQNHAPKADLVDCILSENAGAGVQASASVLTALRCSILNNRGPGLYLKQVGAAGIHECLIQYNSVGLQFGGYSSGTIADGLISTNNISENGTYEIEQVAGEGGSTVYANGNYWGPQTTTELARGERNLSRIRDARDDGSLGPVVITSWLGSWPPCSGNPAIQTQPADLVGPVGGSVTFTVAATGTPPLRYQWRRGTVDLVGRTNAQLTLDALRVGDAGNDYNVVVSDGCGSTPSRSASLVVLVAPSITVQPAPVRLRAGETARFHVEASGSEPLSYRWQKDNVTLAAVSRISGTATRDLVITSVTAADEGLYRCVVSNAAGETASQAARLEIIQPPAVVAPPASQLVLAGSNVLFEVVVSGSSPFTYQWMFDGVPIPGATGPGYAIPSVSTDQAGRYSVRVDNDARAPITVNASLGVKTLETCAVITLYGPVGTHYRVEWSDPLTPDSWRVLEDVRIPHTPYVVVDLDSGHARKRFYQTRLLEP